MKNIYINETNITVSDCPLEGFVLYAKYSKQRLLDTIREFPDLVHELMVYRFLYWDGTIHETINLSEFARLNKLNTANLYNIHKHSRFSYKGLIKCPEEATDDLEENRLLHKSILFTKDNERINLFFRLNR